MGNGRWSGKSAAKSAATSAAPNDQRNSGARQFLLPGALFVLIFAGCFLLRSDLGREARHGHANNLAQLPASPLTSFPAGNFAPRSSSATKPDARSILGQLPLIFEPNQGQADFGVKFLARGAGYGLFLDGAGATLTLQTAHSAHSKPAS